MNSLLAKVKSFFVNLVLWSFFVVGLGLSGAAKQIFDGSTQQNLATYGGGIAALVAGSQIAKKPRIKAFLGRPGTLWFLFLVNGAAAAVMYFAMSGLDRYIGSGMMGLVSLGALGGLVSGRKNRNKAPHAAAHLAEHAHPE
ncbi:hypothetical protein [Streptomyces fuscichromogenes]|uniref:Uncharacterized protein n=1 Tax=Streptomyces fuscichromogenes TaxID=1324013 RepID=A0A918CXA0_9ACTN|nr:hypothetical protein [Streptomyces fuscichromogenes]GGN44010.1 hypothetical protein GCM10011578_094610 [Streptomyces fuscichromogenes]